MGGSCTRWIPPTRPTNLSLAITGDAGRVQFYGDFEIITPVDRAQPTVLYVVNNRGRRTWGSEPFFLSRSLRRIYWIPSNSTSKTRFAFGGMGPPGVPWLP